MSPDQPGQQRDEQTRQPLPQVRGVDDDGLHLAKEAAAGSVCDVLIDGQHVWSLQPQRDGELRDNGVMVPWPPALRRFLTGSGTVTVRSHDTSTTLYNCEHRFSSDEGRVRVVDRHGNSLMVDKWGRMERPLSAENDDTMRALLKSVAELLRILQEEGGVPAFLAYGTLLGAVREGQLISYDNDIDLAYVSAYDHPVDVGREAYRVERALRARGLVVRRAALGRLNVRLATEDGTWRGVDVFTAFWVNGVFYQHADVRANLPRQALLPLTEVELCGMPFPAPADPGALLAATYGKSWRVPDPSWRYDSPRGLRRRLGGWLGGLNFNRKYWDGFYAGGAARVPRSPSPFAEFVAAREPSTEGMLVDLGSGTARDAIWFAEHGREVLGLDYAMTAVNSSRRRCEDTDLPVRFEEFNLYDLRAVLAMGGRLARMDRPVSLYARFLPHALSIPGRRNLWRLASMALRRGGNLYIEFRTDQDAEGPFAFGRHFRRFLEPGQVARELSDNGGGVRYQEIGRGLAPLEGEDPHICRMVASWA